MWPKIGCHGDVLLSDRKINDLLVIPSMISTNPENVVKIGPVDSEIYWSKLNH